MAIAISEIKVTEANPDVSGKFTVFVQGKSKLNIVTTASEEMKSCVVSIINSNGVKLCSYVGEDVTTGEIMASGQVTVSVTVRNNNGESATKTATLNFAEYHSPLITSMRAYRSTELGERTEDGRYLTVDFVFYIASVNEQNDKTYTIEYKVTTDSEWTTLVSGNVYTLNSKEISASELLDADTSYDVRLTVSDYFGTHYNTANVPTTFVLMDVHYGGKAVAFGKVCERENGVEFGMPVYFTTPPIVSGGQKVLWEGSAQMGTGVSISFSERISEQPNGIVLTFGASNSASYFHHFFIPRHFISDYSNYTHMFQMTTKDLSVYAVKMLNITQIGISGNDYNTKNGTGTCGITYTNNAFVLKRVTGV